MKTPAKKAGVLRPEVPSSATRPPGWLRRAGFGQPDSRRNYHFWPLRWVYGAAPRQLLCDLVRESQSILELGSASGWLTWEMSLANANAQIVAVEPTASQLDWARENFAERRPGVSVEFVNQKLDELSLPDRQFDLVVLSFSVRRCKDPMAFLDKVLPLCKPGARVFYYEGTEPTQLNLERLSKWMYRRARLRGLLTDLWNQRRRLQGMYLEDAVRGVTRAPEFNETDFYSAFQRHFEIVKHARRRSFVDLLLSGLQGRSWWVNLPIYLGLDRLATMSGYLEGCCRVAVGRLRNST
jgi:ubiquinone/menaquinone biosynthesis C-methylase UbiE